MKKIQLAIIACMCLMLSCCGIPKSIRNAFTCHYKNMYSGIDTLINIEGCYSDIIFYDNGMVIRVIYAFGAEFFSRDLTYIDSIVKDPNSKYAINFYNVIDCGGYTICGDTIKVQMLHNYHSLNDDWDGWEEWYKIVDKNTLSVIERFRFTTNKGERERSKERYKSDHPSPIKISFAPMPSRPALEHFWILKEEWFWCDEQDWKNYMKHAKQVKKQLKKE